MRNMYNIDMKQRHAKSANKHPEKVRKRHSRAVKRRGKRTQSAFKMHMYTKLYSAQKVHKMFAKLHTNYDESVQMVRKTCEQTRAKDA